MQARFTVFVIVWCFHVLKCHLATGSTDLFSLFPSLNSAEDCKKCNGACVDPIQICDGVVNCPDGSDEENCDFIKCREPKYFKCHDSKCIPAADVCNKQKDCGDGEDEENCESKTRNDITACTGSEFRCDSNGCIPGSWVCDGVNDCGDNSDETRGCEEKKCSDHEFRCKNNRCIPLPFRCDGNYDCNDQSDEENCETKILDMTNCTTNQGKFACKDKLRCIDLYKACDDFHDCLDGSDEGKMCMQDFKKVCTNCSHKCVLTPEKAVCSCFHGFVLTSDNTCKDINECEQYGICDQKCLNTEGSYSCACDLPYVLQSDKTTCKIPGNDAVLLYSTSTGLKGIHLRSREKYSIFDYNAVSLGISVAGSCMYWTAIVHDTAGIYKATTKDYISHEIVTSGLGNPEDIDVDGITGNIYFTDSKFKHIGVCNGDGQHCIILHQKKLDKPRSISLSPENGLLFWTDWGSKPMIGKSGMDGSNAEEFVSKNVHWPNGICTDTPNERVYWVDAKQHIIESIKFDGSDRRLVLSDYVKSPLSISIFENKLYWSNWDENEILECDKFTGKNRRTVIRDPSHKIHGIHVEHPSRYDKEFENPCADNLCSDLCLLAPGSKTRLRYSCGCPEDKELTENLKTCRLRKNTKYLMAAFKNKAYVIEPKNLGHASFGKYPLSVESIKSMAYDYLESQLIIVDTNSAFLKSYNFSVGNTLTLPGGGISHVPSMQYDDFGNNLYWCDLDSLTIEAMSLKTYSKTVIWSSSAAEAPIEIALVPSKGYMFVAFSMSYSRVQIDRISMDGSVTSRSQFLNDEMIGPNVKMYYDTTDKRLFWADISSGVIESVNENGGDRTFHAKTSNLFSMTYVDGAVFWTRKKFPHIYWKENSDVTNHVNRLTLDIGHMYEDEGIIIINPSNNITAKPSSPCSNNNGGCSHLCLLSSESPKKSVCACPIGSALSANGFMCRVPQNCSTSQFTCFTGECISSGKVCDKRKDCLHGEDESLENCRQMCPDGQFLCHDGTKCIDAKLRCDGKFDCTDKSDEVCHVNCTEGMFNCENGDCIESQFRCDGKVDCKGGLDERNCHLTTCKTNEFRCTSGQCIHISWFCDGQNDCTDGSDELRNCTAFEIQCRRDEFRCTNGKCVNITVTCDRHDDCGDNSDEDKECIKNPYIYKQPVWYTVDHHLHVFKQCNSRIEFQCPTKTGKHCIPIASRCDGVVNCLNGEDEQNCGPNKCPNEQEFFCKNTRCISNEWVCDHRDDCGDNSDEVAAACVTKNVTKTVCSGFQCLNGECLSLSKVCDEIPDCSDKSDEGGLCGSGCEQSGCSHKCHETPKGSYCTCDHGYELGLDNKTCTDIDECKKNICSQNCTNTPGSFVCSCFSSDYTLKSDRVTCKATGDAAHFVIASMYEMHIVTNNWMRITHLLKSPTGSIITAMDVDSRNSIVYAVYDHSTINQIDVLKSERKRMFVPIVYGVAADWITENVYYIKNRNKIMVSSFAAKKSAVVYVAKESIIRILSMAVDPVEGYLFWYESFGGDHNYNMGIIKRADCNGANIVNITTPIENTIESMTVDSYEKYLYLYEKYESTIVRLKYDGNNVSLVQRIESHVLGISLFENSIYWANDNSDIYPIRKCNNYGLYPRKCETIRSKLTDVRYFGLMQINRQRIVSNPCKFNTCSDICTSSPTGPKCLLFDGSDSSINPLQLPEKIETASFSTTFAYVVVLCLIIALGFFLYRYYKPKSQLFHRFHFYSASLNEQLYNSRASGINEMSINKGGNAFLESVTEEIIDSEFNPVGHETARESLIKSNL